jgi:hypothetical protein
MVRRMRSQAVAAANALACAIGIGEGEIAYNDVADAFDEDMADKTRIRALTGDSLVRRDLHGFAAQIECAGDEDTERFGRAGGGGEISGG